MNRKKLNLSIFLILSLSLMIITLYLDHFFLQFAPYLRNPFINDIFMFFGAASGIFVYLCFINFFFLLEKKYQLMVYLIASVIITFLLSSLLKYIILRPRPELFPLLIKSSPSFPSTHAAIAASTIFFINKLKTKTTAVISLILTITVILTGYYNGVHYLSDILGGVLLGVVVSYLVVKYVPQFIKKMFNLK